MPNLFKNIFFSFILLAVFTLVFPFLAQASENEISTVIGLPFLGETDLAKFSLPVLAVVLGSVDGLNVCSIGALIMVLSIALVFKKTSLVLLLGSFFLVVVASVYGLLVFIWYQIFAFVMPYFGYMRIIIGTIALLGGIYFFFEFLRLRKVGLACKISESKLMEKTIKHLQEAFQSPKKSIPALIFAVIFFAAMATIVEFPCSAAIPLVFTGILAGSGLSGAGYAFYIFLYLFFYLLIELTIFLAAVFTKKIWLGHGKIAAYAALVGSLVLFYLAYYYYFDAVHI